MKKHVLITFALFAITLVGSGPPLQAADTLRPLEVDDYFALKNIGSPGVSPDGKWVAYTVNTQDLEKDSR